MPTEIQTHNPTEIKNLIYTIRGLQVMTDWDLADIYQVETKVLNQAVKRNILRFPDSFKFQLTEEEFENLKSQIVTSSTGHGGRRYLPFVFTEQGVAMLSAVLKSKIAVEVSVQIMSAFVEMRKMINTHAGLMQRLDKIELTVGKHEQIIDNVFKAMEGSPANTQGIFYDGQIFDAYTFVADLIRSANSSIRLVDNFVDDSVLTLLTKRKANVEATIYSKAITKEFQLDLEKYNSQYEPITVTIFNKSHDRFLIIDDTRVYHIGASIKDLGKKWFAFSLMDIDSVTILDKLKEK